MRKLLRLAVLLVILAVVVVAVGWYYIDALAKTGVERGATYALGVPTTAAGVKVGLLAGTVRIDGLTVANPEGFTTPHLMRAGRFDLAVRTGSLFSDTIEVSRFELDGLDLHIEQKLGASNISTVLDNIKAKAGEPAPEAGKEEAGKKVKADRIVVRNVTAHIQLLPVGGQAGTIDVEVPEIILENVTSDEAGGVAVAELTRRLIPAILTAVIGKARDVAPGANLDWLAGDVGATVNALGGRARDLVEQAGQGAGKVLENIFKLPGGQGGKEGGGLLDGILKKKDEAGAGEGETGAEGEKKGGLGGALENLFKKDDEPE
ncbi:MAG: hypothetical protein ISS74_09430 [Planctomycetes bacterium]|nr:hypothetical protein [Planctomycetota bacterium]